MTDEQRNSCTIFFPLHSARRGYPKATGIMHLDNLLNMYYDSLFHKRNQRFHPPVCNVVIVVAQKISLLFWPASRQYMGYKTGGHHLSVNSTFVERQTFGVPFFIGTDPVEYQDADYAGWRVCWDRKTLHQTHPFTFRAQQKQAVMGRRCATRHHHGSRKRQTPRERLGYYRRSNEPAVPKALLQYIIREFLFNMEYLKPPTEYEKNTQGRYW